MIRACQELPRQEYFSISMSRGATRRDILGGKYLSQADQRKKTSPQRISALGVGPFLCRLSAAGAQKVRQAGANKHTYVVIQWVATPLGDTAHGSLQVQYAP